MKKKKYLPLYYKWNKRGMPGDGLCESFKKSRMDYELLRNEFCANSEDATALCWDFYMDSENYDFNGVRQNIVLLLAAQNNEL